MIELGLKRIGLLAPKAYSWKAVHVAGTNGKGSISAYLSAMIKEAGFRSARFNSPHLIDRWDCISVDDEPVNKSVFEAAERTVRARDRDLQSNASEFELLTATALEVFNTTQPPIDYGVIEVGLGGRLDATNILNNVDVSVIAKIGLDHQSLLGNTLQEIAKEKAGIMRPLVPCIVDGTNQLEVQETLQAHAKNVGTPLSFVTRESQPEMYRELQPFFKSFDLEPHQQTNLLVAVEAMEALLAKQPKSVTRRATAYLDGIHKVNWPGRLQRISLAPLTGRKELVLLDGAHNLQSAEALAQHVKRTMRSDDKGVTWVIAASEGKDITKMLECCIRNGDSVVPVTFGPVDGMPWVKSASVHAIASASALLPVDVEIVDIDDADMDGLVDRLRLAADIANERPMVIAGSLYLVSDVLRLLRDTQ